MQPTKLEYIKEQCRKTNPEIVELKFGCRIVDFMHGEAVIVGIEEYDKKESNCYYQFYDEIPNPMINLSPYHNWTILGRDIRLADCILACELKLLGKHKSMNYPQASKLLGVINWWNKRQDSLDLQSQETIDFLAELLGYNSK